MGLTTGVSFAGILFLGFGAFSHLFTTDPEVLKVAWSGLFVSVIYSLFSYCFDNVAQTPVA